jgi:hypothetical protein
MEPMGPPRNAPGGLARLQAVRSVKHRTFERDNCHSGKEWCQAAAQPGPLLSLGIAIAKSLFH